METTQIPLDADLIAVLEDIGRPPKESVHELVVLELYREGLISTGKAAELMRLSRLDFIRRAGQEGIPYFRMSADELRQDIEEAKSL